MTQRKKDIAVEFLALIVDDQVRHAYDLHVGEGFRHHNPYFPGDAASLRKGMESNEIEHPGKTIDVHHVVEEGDTVIVHSRLANQISGLDMSVVHIFRFEGEKIMELWDIGQPVPANVVNERGMF